MEDIETDAGVLVLSSTTGGIQVHDLGAVQLGNAAWGISTTTSGDISLLNPLDFGPVHGILAAPPCTHFAVSGARWWKRKGPDALL